MSSVAEALLKERDAAYAERDLHIRAAELMEQEIEKLRAARIAETHGVYPELNVWGGGPEWYRHGREIAAAILALIPKGAADDR